MLFRRHVPARPNPRVSVVVPMYDVEKYLEACLDSIARQPVADHEVVVVDDGSPDARAFLSATAFDVLTETVYRWSVREDRSSITQRRHELADLLDRMETKRDTAAVVRERADSEVLRVFHAKVLPIDMWEYFRAVPGCDPEYWSLLVKGAASSGTTTPSRST